ncbi:MAG: pirin family protein [Mongoliibacter sp.]|uniref:pirin family protein n=1 Tax=Mongoliibacter sp. TaxID=2022438 RepID=UPI0012F39C39|nr:pirin family protein [Mongoliibacter sp.]TVP50852.1 MAG: pirin family protein [Mongoliibacter sp.]
MSNISLIIEERAANIGNFMVGRLLPFRQKRAVGPFVFIDHMGPAKLKDYQNLDVPPHPHIGLSTLTYLFEGSIIHRDSIGSEVEIKPGAVNWMTSGKGVVHSERTPEYLRETDKSLHGLQIWVALPKELEESEPTFTHVEADQIPSLKLGSATVKVIAGEVFGLKSPVPVHSKLFMIEIKSKTVQKINIGEELFGESGLYILEGSVNSDGHTYGSRQILIATDSSLCEFEIEAHSTVYIFGGEPFPEERYIDWNLVSSSKERLKEAREMWKNQEFPKVPGETDFVPYPEFKKG